MDIWQLIKAAIVGLMVFVGFGAAGHTVYWLLRYVALGRKEDRFDSIGERVRSFIVYVLGQRAVMRELGGLFHVFIFWGFLILQAETLEYIIRGFVPGFSWTPILGEAGYDILLFGQDIFGALVFVAIIAAFIRRFIIKPDHVLPSMDALIILILIAGLMVTKFFANGTEIALGNQAHDVAWTPIATLISHLVADGPGTASHNFFYEALYHGNYFLHIAIVVFFANWIPRGKHLHLIGAMPNVFFRHFDQRRSALPHIDMDKATEAMMDPETGADFYLGAKNVEDLTWKQLLDTYACTECGRCEAYCPAYNTGKALNPMMVIHNIKDALKEVGHGVLRDGKEYDDFQPAAGGYITQEELWACTTCGACVANCPVFIEHVNTIVDLRRYLAFTGDVPQELANTYRNMEQSYNPWGMSNSKRADWASDLGIPHLRDLDHTPEYLFFVGCAGSFDDRQKKVTRAFASILKEAGVDFAILGKEEKCNGDTARRSGNEYLYWTLATEMIQTFDKYDVTKVVTTCPHCFNIIANEYPQLGGNYEVIHHTSFIKRLLDEERLTFRPGSARTITYHDSCYLGRWNDNYDNPRDVLKSIPGTELREMELNRRTSMCCGAGGARMWMEEDAGKRVNVERTDQFLETGSEVLAVGCPFCMTMLDDGLKHRDAEHAQALDIAEIVAEAMVVLFEDKEHGKRPAEADAA